MSKSIIQIKSYQYSLIIISTYKFLVNTKKEFILSKQLIRSGTAVGAMVRESEFAQSKADFIHKLHIGQKECSESLYWIELLKDSDYIDDKIYSSLWNQGKEVLNILSKIIITSKKNL